MRRTSFLSRYDILTAMESHPDSTIEQLAEAMSLRYWHSLATMLSKLREIGHAVSRRDYEAKRLRWTITPAGAAYVRDAVTVTPKAPSPKPDPKLEVAEPRLAPVAYRAVPLTAIRSGSMGIAPDGSLRDRGAGHRILLAIVAKPGCSWNDLCEWMGAGISSNQIRNVTLALVHFDLVVRTWWRGFYQFIATPKGHAALKDVLPARLFRERLPEADDRISPARLAKDRQCMSDHEAALAAAREAARQQEEAERAARLKADKEQGDHYRRRVREIWQRDMLGRVS